MLGLDAVEGFADGACVGDVLTAGDCDQGAVGQMRLGLAVLAGAEEVASVDGGGGEFGGALKLLCIVKSCWRGVLQV